MRAIDTNIIVRLLTADDPIQAKVARAVVETGDVFVGMTVLLETEWVLRAGYHFQPLEISAALRAFAGLPTVKVESATELSLALNGLEHGIDFADALHVARAAHCEAFVTFDRKFANRAKAVSPIPVLSAYTKVRAS